MSLDCFKAYDVRGRIPDQLNEDIARRIGRAYAEVIQPGSVVVGHDIRLTSEAIKAALIEGLREQGVSVQDIGLCGTEEIYFATAHLGVGGGIAVTASHNPKDYNGMKFVREGAKPISGDSGLADIRALAEGNAFTPAAAGRIERGFHAGSLRGALAVLCGRRRIEAAADCLHGGQRGCRARRGCAGAASAL